jgi:hypothetical protein
MKYFILIGLYWLSLVPINFVSGQTRIRKVVFMIVDGIPPDALEKVNTPNLNRIAQEGAYFRAHVGGDKGDYNETPTVSAISYNSLLTGTWINKHHVTGNDIKSPNYNYWTLFRFLKTEFPDKKTAIFSSWLDNRTKLLGDGLGETGNMRVDIHKDGYELDTLNFPHDKADNYMHKIDEMVADSAAWSIRNQAPDLSWVYLEWTDDIGHAYGDSPQFNQAIAYMDDQVGRIYNAIEYRRTHFKEDWLFIVTTDHGRNEQNGRGHGGQSPRQRSTWMLTNYKNLNAYAQYFTPGIVDISPTIFSYMGVEIPEKQAWELDGTSLIGPVSIAGLNSNYIQGNLDISWKVLDPKGNLKIYISPTNHFYDGGEDSYFLRMEVPVSRGHALISLEGMPSSFYKVVLKAPYNTLNRWIMPQAMNPAKSN